MKSDLLDLAAMLEHTEAALAHSDAIVRRHAKDEAAPLHIFGVNAELVRVSLMIRGLREVLRAEEQRAASKAVSP